MKRMALGLNGRGAIAASLLAPALLAGCGAPKDEREIERQSEASTPAATPTPTAAGDMMAEAPEPQAFVTKIGQGAFYDVAAARVALQRTHSNEVRNYANQVMRDYRRASGELKAATARDGSSLVLPAGPDERQRAAIEALETAPNFDGAYLQQQRRSHEERLGDLRRFAATGKGEALRVFAADTASVVGGHRDRLRRIEVAAGNDGRTDRPEAAGRN